MSQLLIQALQGKQTSRIPFWFMRQAGRFLPEYRAVRETTSSFLEFCYTPDKAAQVTLQPLERFDMDAAILFSDILVIPDALGQEVTFVKGEGPKLVPIRSKDDLDKLELSRIDDTLSSIYRTVEKVKEKLDKDKSLIGFCGAPWTVACYMIEGQGSKEFAEARKLALTQPELFTQLMDMLVASSSQYLIRQVKAGADALQIFDSWAGLVPDSHVNKWIIEPTKRIISQVKQAYPDIPIIGFPKGIGANAIRYAKETGINGMGLDQGCSLEWAVKALPSDLTLQGNLDNVLLASDGDAAVKQTQAILRQVGDRPFIFNLGHGILPWTPIDHVRSVVDVLQEWKR